ncbi:putative benzoate 4-monooxygenase cytochrome p450 protein [Anopheles sinensis]|uniref:Putative benzoate 4-monooxygenase cytochrome p450 protein n=1 Tax=Anopheles sinensis TaxID=74873 RepID=A0A084WK20_ANOSI|nr:putative benzoate 4-monooxygenase cytochrome p450 protein [Anopheles sinensis]
MRPFSSAVDIVAGGKPEHFCRRATVLTPTNQTPSPSRGVRLNAAFDTNTMPACDEIERLPVARKCGRNGGRLVPCSFLVILPEDEPKDNKWIEGFCVALATFLQGHPWLELF